LSAGIRSALSGKSPHRRPPADGAGQFGRPDIKSLDDIPIRSQDADHFIRDVGSVEDGVDIQTGYAVGGWTPHRLHSCNQRADASTSRFVQAVKANLPRFQSVFAGRYCVSYKFDQSPYVTRVIQGLFFEGALWRGADKPHDTLFLRDWRSAFSSWCEHSARDPGVGDGAVGIGSDITS